MAAPRPPTSDRLWAMWATHDGKANLSAWAARRPGETAVVILEPRGGVSD